MSADLLLLGGEFIVGELPADKAWLNRYFRSDLTKRFVVYYVTFREQLSRMTLKDFCELFIDHTGFSCSMQLLCRIAKKVRELEEVVDQAEKTKDLALLAEIKLGKYNLGND